MCVILVFNLYFPINIFDLCCYLRKLWCVYDCCIKNCNMIFLYIIYIDNTRIIVLINYAKRDLESGTAKEYTYKNTRYKPRTWIESLSVSIVIRAGTSKQFKKKERVWMFIVIHPINYWHLLYGEFTMVWRVVNLLWCMALIEFLVMCGGL